MIFRLVNNLSTIKHCVSRKQRGAMLIDVLVSLAVISLVGGGFLNVLGTSAKASDIAKERTMAESLAQAQLEDIMQSEYDSVSPFEYSVITYPDPNYGIEITVELIDSMDDGIGVEDDNYGTEDDDYDDVHKITIQVSHNSNEVLSVQTYKAKHG